MRIESTTTGGFSGDPAEAFAPSASSGCCGTRAARADSDQPMGSTCCGTTEGWSCVRRCRSVPSRWRAQRLRRDRRTCHGRAR